MNSTGEKLTRIMAFTLIISAMSGLMFMFVLPQMSKEFHLSMAQTSWMTTSYSLIYALGTVTYGKLTERFQLKSLITFGILVFAIGSLIGLISTTFAMAIVGRCLQSVGASVIPATAMLIPIRYFTPETRGKAMGMTALGLAVGSAIGPVVTSFIVSVAHWRWLFAVPLLSLIVLPFFRKYLADEPKTVATSTSFDGLGGGLLGATVTLFMLGITNGTGWYFIGSLITLVLFIIRIRTATAPFIQPILFRNKKYTLGITLAFLASGSVASLYFLSPLFLSSVYHLPANMIGFSMVPAAVVSALVSRKAGSLADSKGDAYLFKIAASLLISSFLLLSTFIGSFILLIVLFLIAGNVGQTSLQLAMNNTISKTLDKQHAGVGMGMLAMLNFIVQGVATTLYGKWIDQGASTQWNPFLTHLQGTIFSNIFLVLVGVFLLISISYFLLFTNRKKTVQMQSLHS
ncbi:MFS transporter, DHA2 family, metal-tetracycline-proton antiporter [Seinonella peptonophila]|uniref:MFS transporter, DHA2 family, metal-tetracycline-proton antiporter n=1 Tax=Seinonella peptonophila TaxID=112248 RepID=A0A1M5BM47_9BACL|nr:MFS transporter [Seinonella peptonophila]SHF43495.1 MFS transporter, DHA2 family, metal-tetracycline-proton antiporter [Seinonella peptonophila]